MLPQLYSVVCKFASELGTPSIQDSQLGPNGVHYTEVPLYVEETGTPYKVSTHSGLHM